MKRKKMKNININLEELNKIIEWTAEITESWKYKKDFVEISDLLESIESEDWVKLHNQLNEISNYNFDNQRNELSEKVKDLEDEKYELNSIIQKLEYENNQLSAEIEELEFKIEELVEGK